MTTPKKKSPSTVKKSPTKKETVPVETIVTGVIITQDSVGLIYQGAPYTISSDSPTYNKLVKLLMSKKYTDKQVKALLSIGDMIEDSVKRLGPNSLLTYQNEQVFFNKTRLPAVLESKLLQDLKNNQNIDSFCLFVENLMQNPSKTSIEELYLFMEKANMPITKQGYFLAYKRIRRDWKDLYTGNMDNSIGTYLSMDREKVDPDRNSTCSRGLHFCSYEYLGSYHSNSDNTRTVVLEVNPKDVVTIPNDYRNTKGRACAYKIVGEVVNGVKPILENREASDILTPQGIRENAKEKSIVKTTQDFKTSKFSGMTIGSRYYYGEKLVTIHSEPTKKSKGAWMVEIKSGKEIIQVRCSELEQSEGVEG